MTAQPDVLRRYPDTEWGKGPSAGLELEVEQGRVLVFPQLRFVLQPQEQRFLDAKWADGKAKNISLRATDGSLRGAVGEEADRVVLHAMLERYRDQSEALVARLFPHYRGVLRRGNTSYRPVAVEGRETSWRKDDSRLHVDAFPSNPVHGVRLLRVFHNLHPDGAPRRWRVGEPFDSFAVRYLRGIPRPVPGSAWLLQRLHVTKARRSEYDHLMLQLHDRVKADLAYQREAPQLAVEFSPGTTWIVFSDQVLHAAMGGQYMMEQTLYLDPDRQQQPSLSPLKVLERLTERALL
ncbi:MAG TPA: Kdo hydroxylase family protein [Burkholderiaceae bacterium]|nr:Kdo hydroxylase family protein [Burkholderiaceae bacterium]